MERRCFVNLVLQASSCLSGIKLPAGMIISVGTFVLVARLFEGLTVDIVRL